ncbi:Armadillo-type fold [Phytophthora cactorum]|nr:Armadillo-type fold [Phytophthora cactorum]
MLDTTAHMLLLLQQAKIKNERPVDASFLPLSLSMACLLRQLPAGLAPPAGGLSFHQLDRLPQEVLERKLAAMLLDDPLRAFTLVCALVKYTKVTRELLSICHDHMSNRVSTVEATQSVVQAVVEALPPLDADVEGDDDDGDEEVEKQEDKPVERPVQEATVKVDAKMTGPSQLSEKLTTSAVATDPAGIMRRAVGRDVGDGSTVLEIMKKFPTDVRIQSHGVRALKGLIRSVVDSEAKKASAESFPTTVSTHEEEDEEDHTEDRHLEDQKTEKSSRLMVQMVIDTMKQFPESLALQRDGLLCLAEYANQADEHIAIITSSGGIISLIDAMVALPDDIPANMAGLSVLAHPKIAGAPSKTRKRFPLNEQVQGLSCLALANLSLRQGTIVPSCRFFHPTELTLSFDVQDASMLEIVSKGGLEIVVESMKRFSSTALVQAAGCWFVAIISGNNEGMKTACLDVGALPVCEKARLRFPDDPKVQQHAVQAIQTMLPGEVIEGDDSSTPETCSLQ